MNIYESNTPYFNTKTDAKDALSQMHGIAKTYGFITLEDIMDICDLISGSNFDKYRWFENDLRFAKIRKDDNGMYFISMPDPEYVKTPPTTSSLPDPEIATLNIVLHTNEVADPDAALTEIFKHIQTIKDRMVNLSIM